MMRAILRSDAQQDHAGSGAGGRWPSAAVLLLLAALASALLVRDLGASSFASSDEALYSQVAREMRASGDLLSLSYQGEPFWHKPPLAIWLIAAGRSVIAADELGSRLPFALTGLLLVVAVSLTACRHGGWVAGLVSGLMLITGHQVLYEHALRACVLEAPLMLTTLGVLVWGLRIGSGWRFAVGAGVCLGLAGMLKPPVAVLPAIVVVAHLARRDRRALASKGLGAGLLALAVALPWHLLELLEHGRAFWDVYVVYEFLGRAGSTATLRSPDRFVHLEALLANFHVWSLPLSAAIIWGLLSASRRTPRPGTEDRRAGASPELRAERASLSLYALGFLLLLGLVAAKWPWYGLPVYPVLAVLTGSFAAEGWRRWPRAALGLLGLLVAGRWALIGRVASYQPASRVSVAWPEETRMLEWLGRPEPLALAVAVAVLLATGLVLVLFRTGRARHVALGTLALALVGIGFGRDVADLARVPLRSIQPIDALSRALARERPDAVLAWGFPHAPRYGGRMKPIPLYYLDGIATRPLVDLTLSGPIRTPSSDRSALVLDTRSGVTASAMPEQVREIADDAHGVWLYTPHRGIGFTRLDWPPPDR